MAETVEEYKGKLANTNNRERLVVASASKLEISHTMNVNFMAYIRFSACLPQYIYIVTKAFIYKEISQITH